MQTEPKGAPSRDLFKKCFFSFLHSDKKKVPLSFARIKINCELQRQQIRASEEMIFINRRRQDSTKPLRSLRGALKALQRQREPRLYVAVSRAHAVYCTHTPVRLHDVSGGHRTFSSRPLRPRQLLSPDGSSLDLRSLR